MTCDVLVVGSLHLDVIVEASRLPRLDETLMGRAVRYQFGGKGGNQAVAAARMGAGVEMAGRIGPDAFGVQLRDALNTAGVGNSQVRNGPEPSGMSVALIDTNGDYGAVVVSGANQAIGPADIHVPPGCSVLCLQNEIPERVNLKAGDIARAQGTKVLLNAAPSRALPDTLLAQTDILIVNRVEADDLAGSAPPTTQAERISERFSGIAIVTLGEDGLVFAQSGAPAMYRSGLSAHVSDTHGAGDAFCGALAAELSRNVDFEIALEFAQAAAALTVSTEAVRRAEIDRTQVLAFLAAQTGSR